MFQDFSNTNGPKCHICETIALGMPRNYSFFHLRFMSCPQLSQPVLLAYLEGHFVAFACQLERGERTGRAHYQLVVKTIPKKTRARMVAEWCTEFPYLQHHVRDDPNQQGQRADGAEWYCEPQTMRGGNRFAYVLKHDTRIGGPWTKRVSLPPPPVELLKPEEMHMWQRSLVRILSQKPNNRTIHWYWEGVGGTGKSVFCKYLCATMGALLCSGRASDMKYLIVQYQKRKKEFPHLILFDVPRTNVGFLDYQGLEEVKNGCFVSTKYECSMVVMDNPHVVVFANYPPNRDKLSEDRWHIVEIQNDDEHETEIQSSAIE